MRKLGVALHESSVTHRLIVRSAGSETAQRKDYVLDKTGKIIGTIDEAFGPALRPYYAVKTARGIRVNTQIGEDLFFVPKPQGLNRRKPVTGTRGKTGRKNRLTR